MAAKLAIASLLEKDEKQKDALITKLEFHSCGNNAVMFWTGEKLKAVVVLDSELKIVSTRIIDARTLEVASEAI
ncbi:MAG: hypothetical protein HRT45_05670 [Bdellovibrionales bacterium]|nr:hypothetical protein [Bdellovibrionales bacterium]